MKKLMKLLAVAFVGFFLVACAPKSVNGTYKATEKTEISGQSVEATMTITIQDTKLSGSFGAMGITLPVEGEVDQTKKVVTLSYAGESITGTYELDKDGDLLITHNNETVEFIRQK